MSKSLIINEEEFASINHLENDYNSNTNPKVKQQIELASDIDLYDRLGSFYFTVLENLDHQDYQDLLHGSFFECNGVKMRHDGLKKIVSDFALSRFLRVINTNLNPFGANTKLSDNSQPVSQKELEKQSEQVKVDANIRFKMVDLYLKSKTDIFSNYQTGNNKEINTHQSLFYNIF